MYFVDRMHRVVVGALVRGGQVVLVHRRPDKRAYPDVWDLPGGVMEAEESERGALARELLEELGVRVATDSASHLCRVDAGPADEPAVLSAWLVRDWEGTPENVAPQEHDDIGWFGLEELPPPAHELVRSALLAAMRATAAELRRMTATRSSAGSGGRDGCTIGGHTDVFVEGAVL